MVAPYGIVRRRGHRPRAVGFKPRKHEYTPRPRPSDLTESQWHAVRYLFPAPSRRVLAIRKSPVKVLLNAMFFRLEYGVPLRQLPPDYPPWGTVHSFEDRLKKSGLLVKIINKAGRSYLLPRLPKMMRFHGEVTENQGYAPKVARAEQVNLEGMSGTQMSQTGFVRVLGRLVPESSLRMALPGEIEKPGLGRHVTHGNVFLHDPARPHAVIRGSENLTVPSATINANKARAFASAVSLGRPVAEFASGYTRAPGGPEEGSQFDFYVVADPKGRVTAHLIPIDDNRDNYDRENSAVAEHQKHVSRGTHPESYLWSDILLHKDMGRALRDYLKTGHGAGHNNEAGMAALEKLKDVVAKHGHEDAAEHLKSLFEDFQKHPDGLSKMAILFHRAFEGDHGRISHYGKTELAKRMREIHSAVAGRAYEKNRKAVIISDDEAMAQGDKQAAGENAYRIANQQNSLFEDDRHLIDEAGNPVGAKESLEERAKKRMAKNPPAPQKPAWRANLEDKGPDDVEDSEQLSHNRTVMVLGIRVPAQSLRMALAPTSIDEEQARQIGDRVGVDWSKIPLEQFLDGLKVELEHGAKDPQTDVTHDDLVKTGMIALAHLKERPDYYSMLKKVEGKTRMSTFGDEVIPPHDSWREMQGEGDYLYHATNLDNLHDIASDQLVPHKPWHGTDQEAWPDGSTHRRSYFAEEPSTAWYFAPENGKPVLLRLPRSSARFKKESTGDTYTRDSIPAHHIEVHTTNGWIPLGRKKDDTGHTALSSGSKVRVLGVWVDAGRFQMSCGKHEYSSTQINLPPDLAAEVLAFGSQIPDEELAEDGRETIPHVTVRYGLTTSEVKDVVARLDTFDPVDVFLGRIGSFPASETGKDHDVLWVGVESEQLHGMNQSLGCLCEEDRFPYRPHVTVAYLRPGMASKYIGKSCFVGKGFCSDEVLFSPAQGDDAFIVLDGTGAVRMAVDQATMPINTGAMTTPKPVPEHPGNNPEHGLFSSEKPREEDLFSDGKVTGVESNAAMVQKRTPATGPLAGKPHYVKYHHSAHQVYPEVATSGIMRMVGFDEVPPTHLLKHEGRDVSVTPAIKGYPLVDAFYQEDPKLTRDADYIHPDSDKAFQAMFKRYDSQAGRRRLANFLTASWLANHSDAHGNNFLVSDQGHIHPIDFGYSLTPHETDAQHKIHRLPEERQPWRYHQNALITHGLVHPNQPLDKAFLKEMLDKKDQIIKHAEDTIPNDEKHGAWRQEVVEVLGNKFRTIQSLLDMDSPTLNHLPEDGSGWLRYNRPGNSAGNQMVWVHGKVSPATHVPGAQA